MIDDMVGITIVIVRSIMVNLGEAFFGKRLVRTVAWLI